MSSLGTNLPAGSSWVLASIFSIIPVLYFHSTAAVRARKRVDIHYQFYAEKAQQEASVAKARKRLGIHYLYAEKAQQEASEDAMKYICTQWAHQDTLDNVPVIVLSTLISAIYNTTYAAVGCGIWSFGRILYTLGYYTGEPSWCKVGNALSLGVQALLALLSGKVVFDAVRADV